MMKIIHKLRNNVKGATAIEYGLIAALIAIACITALGAVGTNLNEKFNEVAESLS